MYQVPIQDARAPRAVPAVGAPTTRTVRNVRYSDSHPWSRLTALGKEMLVMAGLRTILSHSFLLGSLALSSGCVIHEHERGGSAAREEAYREGYYDREHNRYYHEHSWHECMEHDAYCH
jgi:hypothetical protein